ncbi:MAG: hypothetical protein AB3N22_16850 [Ruegeria sp.]
MTDTISLNYTIDDGTAHTMIKEMMAAPPALRRLGTAAAVSLSAMAMIVGMLTGFVMSFYAGWGQMAFAVLPIALGFACVLACYFWAQRVNTQARQSQIDVMKPGSSVSYRFDTSGFSLTTWYQQWQTTWAGVTDIRTSDAGLVIMCGLFGFVIPRSALGDDPQGLGTQISALWTANR